MVKKKPPIDLLDGPKMALAGDIVAMDDALSVIRDGRLYVDKGVIVAIRRATDPAPPGFESVSVLNTGGTIFPGLIELHNHLAYNALRLWQVPKKYDNRDQWSGIPEYRKLVSGPMTVVGKSPELLSALIRYVEAKCLVGGVTTSQGIALFSNAGIRRFYRGIVRNVEETDDDNLPEVETRIADVEAQSAQKFLARLKRETCFLLHLSEGLDAKAREHFLALNFAPNQWAITPQLAGIHCAALKPEDFSVYGQFGGAMVWSPLSNLLLYGATANVAAAIAAGVRIGIGSDWSPSGSKNLLGEIKVAWLIVQQIGGIARHDIIAMATRTAARILGWGSVVGFLKQDTQDPVVGAIKLSQATATLKDALSKLPALAKALEQPQPVAVIGRRSAPMTWQLALDEIEDTGFDLRPRLRSRRTRQLTGPARRVARATKPLSQILEPLELDPLSVVDDPDFLPALAKQRNLPQFVKDGLTSLYG